MKTMSVIAIFLFAFIFIQQCSHRIDIHKNHSIVKVINPKDFEELNAELEINEFALIASFYGIIYAIFVTLYVIGKDREKKSAS